METAAYTGNRTGPPPRLSGQCLLERRRNVDCSEMGALIDRYFKKLNGSCTIASDRLSPDPPMRLPV